MENPSGPVTKNTLYHLNATQRLKVIRMPERNARVAGRSVSFRCFVILILPVDLQVRRVPSAAPVAIGEDSHFVSTCTRGFAWFFLAQHAFQKPLSPNTLKDMTYGGKRPSLYLFWHYGIIQELHYQEAFMAFCCG